MAIDLKFLGYTLRKIRNDSEITLDVLAKEAKAGNASVLAKLERGESKSPTFHTVHSVTSYLTKTDYMKLRKFKKESIIQMYKEENGGEIPSQTDLDDTINLIGIYTGLDEGYDWYKAGAYTELVQHMKEVFGEEDGPTKETDDNMLTTIKSYMNFVKFQRDLKEKVEGCFKWLKLYNVLNDDDGDLKLVSDKLSLTDCFNDKGDGQKKYHNALMKMLKTPSAENAYKFILIILEETTSLADLVNEEEENNETDGGWSPRNNR